jgi:hypothetical protein
MSRLNGKFGIVDEADSNKTIVSLRLTDAALKEILNHKKNDLFIRFEDKDSFKGEIRFPNSSQCFNSQPREGVDIFCQRKKAISVSNIGESKQLLKIEANIKSSAERLKKSLNEAIAKDQERVVQSIEVKQGKSRQPKYVRQRPGTSNQTKFGKINRPDLDSISNNRTPTPDPTQNGHLHGSFRNRLLHILALYDKKPPKLGDIKKELISRRLTSGPELNNIEPMLKTLAKEKNKRWFINRTHLSRF